METAILSRDNSKQAAEINKRLVWFAVLFSERVNYITPTSNLLNIEFMRSVPFNEKFRLYRELLPMMCPTDTVEQLESDKDKYLKLKQKKGKNKIEMLMFMNLDKMFRKCESWCIQFLRNIRDDQGLKLLDEFNCSQKEKVIDCWFPAGNFERDQMQDPMQDPILDMLIRIIRGSCEIPVMNISVRNTSVYREGFSFKDYEGQLIVSPEYLFSIPFPQGLSSEQIKIVRTGLMQFTKDLFGYIGELTRDKERIDFSSPKTQGALDNIFNVMFRVKPRIQSAIDTYTYIEYLRTLHKDEPELKMHLGFCSNNNLLKAYWDIGTITDSMYMHIRDRVTGKADMAQSCLPFIVVDTGIN